MMGGFQNHILNLDFKESFFNIIITALITGCELMVEDCCKHHLAVQNHEEKIRTHLVENYLEDDEARHILGLESVPIRFLPEVPENYDKKTDTYMGRTDIRVVSSNWFGNRKDYYTIECKRIDGTKSLNQKYVDEGICRFTGANPKYPSFHNWNIMLGFLVKDIDCEITIRAIADIHKKEIGDIIDKDITVCKKAEDYCLCESAYTNHLSLSHIFYNVSSVISP